MTDTTQSANAASPRRIAYMVSGERVAFVLNSRHRSYHLKSQQGQDLLKLLRADVQDLERIGELSDIITYIAKQTNGRVTVDDCDRLRLDGKLIDFGLSGRIASIVEAGVPFDALSRFIENVNENPDRTVPEDLYRFMEKGAIPLDPEGYILVFKKVDDNYDSFYSLAEKVRYTPGTVVEMPREECDPNRQRTCSRGLHGCSYEYLNVWYKGRGRVIIGRIHPRDVTAIPADHNDQKLRCCRMEVVGEIPEEDARDHFQSVVDRRYPPKLDYPTWDLSDGGRLAGGPAITEAGAMGWVETAKGMVWDVTTPAAEDEGGEPTGPADAINDHPVAQGESVADDNTEVREPLAFAAPDDDDGDQPFNAYDCGRDEGFVLGREDKANGFPADDTLIRLPGNLSEAELVDFQRGHAYGYLQGYNEPADEAYASGEGEGRWTLARAKQEGRFEGKAQAEEDFDSEVDYSNSPHYSETLRDALIRWLGAHVMEPSLLERHAFVVAFDREFRDAYHAAYNARLDAAV